MAETASKGSGIRVGLDPADPSALRLTFSEISALVDMFGAKVLHFADVADFTRRMLDGSAAEEVAGKRPAFVSRQARQAQREARAELQKAEASGGIGFGSRMDLEHMRRCELADILDLEHMRRGGSEWMLPPSSVHIKFNADPAVYQALMEVVERT